MPIQRQSCPFHSDDDVLGTLNPDGAYVFTCDRKGHSPEGPYSWLHDPVVETETGLGGLAEELSLAVELPAALKALGSGWFEYGLVEREYAHRNPEGFATMVDRWGHASRGPKQYTCSAYIAGVLGRLSRENSVAFHPGVGTGRWSYNSDISYWSIDPEADWEQRTTWASKFGDGDPDPYVPGTA